VATSGINQYALFRPQNPHSPLSPAKRSSLLESCGGDGEDNPDFIRTVVLLIHYDSEAAIGLKLNMPPGLRQLQSEVETWPVDGAASEGCRE
jgi:hypothetical protein